MNLTPQRHNKGFTFIELLVVITIISILAAAAMPISQLTLQRSKELELRRALRSMRRAIDRYKENYDKHKYKDDEEVGRSGYPLELDELVEKKLMRTIPIDPISGRKEWRTVSATDEPDSSLSDEEDVYDVHSTSDKVGLNEIPYSEW